MLWVLWCNFVPVSVWWGSWRDHRRWEWHARSRGQRTLCHWSCWGSGCRWRSWSPFLQRFLVENNYSNSLMKREKYFQSSHIPWISCVKTGTNFRKHFTHGVGSCVQCSLLNWNSGIGKIWCKYLSGLSYTIGPLTCSIWICCIHSQNTGNGGTCGWRESKNNKMYSMIMMMLILTMNTVMITLRSSHMKK